MRSYSPRILSLGTALTLASLLTAPALAQTMDTAGPHSAYCGSWQSGTWTPSGNCVDETTTTTTVTTSQNAAPGAVPPPAAMPPAAMPPAGANAPGPRAMSRVSGTIIAVRGHLVTLQQSTQTIVVNDQLALDRSTTGKVAVGRVVQAHGYWDSGTFMVTRMD